ncbi:hypothetical protein D9758_006602 [Tetrapyrgos nigripes]|uniref:Uncharacterized protein n=1 Tax=Tetrapyrgos nigripes TaxID=182062 RepID=A0A8H5LQQ8_9AGAR|nr:hypothetical protein D9758_006602 [Tetrapyrgos nigripes]
MKERQEVVGGPQAAPADDFQQKSDEIDDDAKRKLRVRPNPTNSKPTNFCRFYASQATLVAPTTDSTNWPTTGSNVEIGDKFTHSVFLTCTTVPSIIYHTAALLSPPALYVKLGRIRIRTSSVISLWTRIRRTVLPCARQVTQYYSSSIVSSSSVVDFARRKMFYMALD